MEAPRPEGGLPAEDSVYAVGVIGAASFAALAVVVRTPGYVLYPRTSEAAYFWPFATHQLYLDVLIAALAVSGALCVATLGGWALARSGRLGGLPGGSVYAVLGAALAAFVSSTYFAVAPFDLGEGLAAGLASALAAWAVLRLDSRRRRAG